MLPSTVLDLLKLNKSPCKKCWIYFGINIENFQISLLIILSKVIYFKTARATN